MSGGGRGDAGHVRTALWIAAALVALAVAAALSPVEARLRYAAQPQGQNLRVEVVLLFGLVHRVWRHPGPPDPRHGHALGPALHDHQPGEGDRAGWTPARRAAAALRHRVRVCALDLDLALGTGDPAETAITAGLAHAVVGTALAVLPAYVRTAGLRSRVRVRPDYGPAALRLELACILRIPLGHLIVALAAALLSAWRGGRTRGRAAWQTRAASLAARIRFRA